MKILYLHQYFKKPTMNGGVRSYEFARRLANDGHDVNIITIDVENKFKGWRVESFENITIHWLSMEYDNKMAFYQRIIVFLRFLFLSSAYVVRLKSDVLIATSTPLTVAVPAIVYRLLKRKPYIFEVRDVWPEVPVALKVLKNSLLILLAKKLELTAYRYAKSVIALSPDMKTSIERRSTINDVHVIPNASDSHLFNRSNEGINLKLHNDLLKVKEKHKKVVFYTGTFGMVNNLKYLLDLSSFSDGEVGFVIIGSGKEELELKAYAKKMNVLDRVVYFYPPVSKNELYIVHDLFDVACSTVLPIPELYANSANKIFDAFASGTPVMINHEGWLKDLIVTKECGVALKEIASDKEYGRLIAFLNNEPLYIAASQNSLRLGKTDFCRDQLYQKFKKIVES